MKMIKEDVSTLESKNSRNTIEEEDKKTSQMISCEILMERLSYYKKNDCKIQRANRYSGSENEEKM
jgi:hypothetical protein